MPADHEIPAAAIAAYEQASGLRVSIHDLAGSLSAFLSPDRFAHAPPPCVAVKRHRDTACIAFDVHRVRDVAARRGDGFIKSCHAGLVEWVVPVARDDALEWVLFAGVRRAGRGLRPDVVDPAVAPPPTAARLLAAVPPIDADAAAWRLEGLRQLAARLAAWRATRSEAPVAAARPRTPIARAVAIHRLVVRRLADPAFALPEVAAALGLSESRAGRAISEACGMGFARLVRESRLRAAAALLRQGELTVADVAARCGFGDRAHFHAVFRAAFGASPARWRRGAGGP
ncbi:MAG TPA: AraC family transcriptional regulator [Planctomycetota bacterium]|nr:AraC family transcriptional regulator [Planctomycetota bacterium]